MKTDIMTIPRHSDPLARAALLGLVAVVGVCRDHSGCSARSQDEHVRTRPYPSQPCAHRSAATSPAEPHWLR